MTHFTQIYWYNVTKYLLGWHNIITGNITKKASSLNKYSERWTVLSLLLFVISILAHNKVKFGHSSNQSSLGNTPTVFGVYFKSDPNQTKVFKIPTLFLYSIRCLYLRKDEKLSFYHFLSKLPWLRSENQLQLRYIGQHFITCLFMLFFKNEGKVFFFLVMRRYFKTLVYLCNNNQNNYDDDELLKS